jgi:hypothetical protein
MALDGAKNKKAQPKAGQVSETMVAGACSHLYRTSMSISKIGPSHPNNKHFQ